MPTSQFSLDASALLTSRLRAKARRLGLLDREPARYARRALLWTPVFAYSVYVAWTQASLSLLIPMSIVAGFVAIQLGLIAHDSGHGAVSSETSTNSIAGHLAFTVLNGLGFESWRISHAAHHAGCQDESSDPDMWVDTVLSLTPDSARSKTGIGRKLLPHQTLTLWFMAFFFAHSLRFQSLGRSYRELARYRLDAVLLPLHYAFWFVIPIALLDVGWSRVIAVYLLSSAAMGLYLAVLFWVNHIGMPVIQASHGLPFFEQQVVGSRNVRCPAGFDWFFGGLNYQIEHHLVPDCPGPRLRELRALVRPLCAGVGLPYTEEGFGEALVSVTRHVREIARTKSEKTQTLA